MKRYDIVNFNGGMSWELNPSMHKLPEETYAVASQSMLLFVGENYSIIFDKTLPPGLLLVVKISNLGFHSESSDEEKLQDPCPKLYFPDDLTVDQYVESML